MATVSPLPMLMRDGVTVRPPRGNELKDLARELSEDPESSRWLGNDVAATERWFYSEGVGAFIIECDGRPAGVITFEEQPDPDYRHASIDIGLLGWCVNRGVGTAALRALIRWLIDVRGHHRVTIDPATDNARAIRAYTKVGFRPVGVMRKSERGSDGTWHDNLLMDLLSHELDY